MDPINNIIDSIISTDRSIEGRIARHLSHALDPAIPQDEAEAAGLAAIRRCRIAGITTTSELAAAIGSGDDPTHANGQARPASDPRLSFGRHRGRKLSTVWKTDPKYIRWIASTDMENVDPEIIEACKQILDEN